ncbi:MAG TPA: amidohydrolase family protein [Bryobacteraceae bacterium]|nr:amidohydrolase family protein [Bryobacteraceae bacterium]
MNRRQLMKAVAAAALGGGQAMPQKAPAPAAAGPDVPLREYEPKSMLHVHENSVERAKFPVIDFHTHITWSGGLSGQDKVTFSAKPEELLPVMDRRNIRFMVNCTGGYGKGLEEAIRVLQQPHPNRFVILTEPAWARIEDPKYPQIQADLIQAAHNAGARGIKVLKTLGLYLREHVKTGRLLKVDDPRFDPMWETAASLKMPIGIHTSDPEAFFLPIDRFNERWEELHNHPDWSFHGKDFPANMELQEQRRNVMRRHPRTQFVCFHVADSENLGYVSECLSSHPNMHVEIAARIGELGRQPRAAKQFMDKYQDRILFGTDAVPKGVETPQQVFGDALYKIYFRFLETNDEYFDYAPAKVPPQGRWRISGLGLSDTVLRKIYNQNAARLLGVSL